MYVLKLQGGPSPVACPLVATHLLAARVCACGGDSDPMLRALVAGCATGCNGAWCAQHPADCLAAAGSPVCDAAPRACEVCAAAQAKFVRRRGQFELLGLDFMVDEDLTPWLIEVNSNPALWMHSATQRQLLPALVRASLDLVLA